MKKLRINKIYLLLILVLGVACNPNEDLYDQMDTESGPFQDTASYTLVSDDYDRFEDLVDGMISEHNAFNDLVDYKSLIPEVLKSRFITYLDESKIQVTFNYLRFEPEWVNAGFGYVLTTEDYNEIGVAGGAFNSDNPARNSVPFFLIRNFTGMEAGDQQSIIYKYEDGGEMYDYLDVYEFTGSEWVWIETTAELPYVGYELTAEDYDNYPTGVAEFDSFNESYPPEEYLPALLRNEFAYMIEGDEQVLKYNYFDGSNTIERIDKFHFDGVRWEIVSYIEERTEQYIYGSLGWSFDPTVDFVMNSSDYQFLVDIDPLGQQEFQYDDFAYYYGSSAFYSNIDVRLNSRRLDLLESGEYADPELGAIYESEGEDAAKEEMIRRVVEEGIPALLQNKYPNAQPVVEGIPVHFFVTFETFGDNWVRRDPRAEYTCTSAGNPPQFELVEVTYPEEEE